MFCTHTSAHTPLRVSERENPNTYIFMFRCNVPQPTYVRHINTNIPQPNTGHRNAITMQLLFQPRQISAPGAQAMRHPARHTLYTRRQRLQTAQCSAQPTPPSGRAVMSAPRKSLLSLIASSIEANVRALNLTRDNFACGDANNLYIAPTPPPT